MKEKNDLPLKPDAKLNLNGKTELRRALAMVLGVREEVADEVIGKTIHEMAVFYEQSVANAGNKDDEIIVEGVLDILNKDIETIDEILGKAKERNICDNSEIETLSDELETIRQDLNISLRFSDLDVLLSDINKSLFPKIKITREKAELLLRPKLKCIK